MNPRRLSDSELFRVTNKGLEEISDETLDLRLNEAERQALRQRPGAYPELLEHPEVA